MLLKKKQFTFSQKRKLFFAVLFMVFVFSAISPNHASAAEYRPKWTSKQISVPDGQTPQAFQTSDSKTLQGMSAYYNDPSKGYYNTPLQSVLFNKESNAWYIKDGNTYRDTSTLSSLVNPNGSGGDLIRTSATTAIDPLNGQTYINQQTTSGAGESWTVSNNWNSASQSAYDQQKNLQTSQDSGSCGINVFCHLKKFMLWLSNLILWLFSWTVWLGAKMLDVALDMPRLLGGFTTAPIVKIGWPIVRDLANMFFSLILLVIAFATILRIESYGMKQVLWRLVIAALLINFSLVIAGVIIDGSNVLTTFFIKGNYTQAGSNQPADISAAILNGLNLQKLFETTDNTLSAAGFQPSGGYTPNPVIGNPPSALQGDIGTIRIILNVILGVIFMLTTAFVLFTAAILFFIRIVVLWILLIFSPLAWLAMILPATKNLWSKWWSEFMKWIIFAPVYGFFIYLTVSMINNGLLLQMLKQTTTATADQGLAISEFTKSASLIVNYIIIIIFMVAGLIFARQTGISGASAMANMGSSVGKGAANFVGRAADRFLAEGAEKTGWQGAIRKPLSYLSPTAWKTGFQRRKAQRDREAFEVAGAARHDSINRFWGGPKKWFKGGSDMQEYRERAKRARRQTERSEIKSNNAEELVAGFEKAKKEKNRGKMGAYAQTLSEQNDLNELFRHYAASGEDGWEMSAEGLEKFVNEKLIRDGGMDKQDGLRVGYDLMRMHEANGQWLGRIIKYDNNTGKYEWETADKDGNDKYEVARKNAYIEWSKQDPQAQARNTGRFSLVREGYRKEDGSGKGGETQIKQMTSNGQRMLAALDPSHAKRFQRHSSNLSVFHFDKELQQINPAVYNTLVEGHQTATKGMNTAQLDKYLAAQQGFIGSDPTTGQKRTPQWFQDIRAKAPAPGSGTGTAGAGGSAAGGGATGGYTGSGWGGP